MIEDVISLVLMFVLGWVCSTMFQRWIFGKVLDRMGISREQLQSLAEEIEDEIEGVNGHTVVDIKLEQHGTAIFAYRKSDDQFLAQGSDADTLIERLNENLTPCRVVVAQEDGADLLQKNNA
jgi:hypothetical protein